MLTISRRMTSRFPKTITRNVTAETPRSGENGNSNSFASLRLRGRSLIRVRSVFDPWRNPQLVLRPILAFNRRRLAWAAVLLLLPLVRFDAAAAQGPDRVLGEPPPWKALKQKPKSTRTGPEKRIELGNQSLRLDFDPRSSDTSYNYLWIRRPDTGRWLRVHNFGIDVHAPKAGDNQDINCVGINLALRREANTVHVGYPRPIIQYRQFDEKVGRADRIRQYPEFTAKELPALVHSDAALEFQYQLDPERPSFTVRGRVLEGRLLLAIYIVDALWTDNHSLPTHEYLAGQAEYDIARPESVRCRDLRFKRVPEYAIFYRHDGQGVPFAFVPLEGGEAGICNFYDNWQCLRNFWKASLNQQFIPDDPAVKGCNDTGYIVTPLADGSLPGVRVVFFPQLGWQQAGTGHELRKKIEDSLRRDYLARSGPRDNGTLSGPTPP